MSKDDNYQISGSSTKSNSKITVNDRNGQNKSNNYMNYAENYSIENPSRISNNTLNDRAKLYRNNILREDFNN